MFYGDKSYRLMYPRDSVSVVILK
uniref:Uncharacterized protein n=1 Tax=Arundo donax TaxID=35708 RepID=A0A0A9BN74_ARUDO